MSDDAPYSLQQQLYDFLPAHYHESDRVEPAGGSEDQHLKKYMGALGSLLDATRYTLEQQHSDSFAQPDDDGNTCQDWVLPYLADLIGVKLSSPYAHGQRDEISNAVRWSQSKGTLATVEQVIESLTQSEGTIIEGWTQVITTARINMPLLPALATGATKPVVPDSGATETPTASNISRHPGLPQTTPRISQHMRAIECRSGNPAAQRWRGNQYSRVWPLNDSDPPVIDAASQAVVHWRIGNIQGTPCFPRSYQDHANHTVVISTAHQNRTPYHPKLLGIYVPPLNGFTPQDALMFPWDPMLASSSTNNAPGTLADYVTQTKQPDGTIVYRNNTAHSLILTGNVTWSNPAPVRFEKLAFADTVKIEDGQASFKLCSVNNVVSTLQAGQADSTPLLVFTDCLLGQVSAAHSVQCEYVTVMGTMTAGRLLASDSIFSDISGAATDDCLRYCRVPEQYLNITPPISRNATMTTAIPNFLQVVPTFSSSPRIATNVAAGNITSGGVFNSPVVNQNVVPNLTSLNQVNVTQTITSNAPVQQVIIPNLLSNPTILDFNISGLGTLNEDDDASLRFGAEDGGELGAFHAFRYAAQIESLKLKLQDVLPIGITPVIIRDPLLGCRPPKLKT